MVYDSIVGHFLISKFISCSCWGIFPSSRCSVSSLPISLLFFRIFGAVGQGSSPASWWCATDHGGQDWCRQVQKHDRKVWYQVCFWALFTSMTNYERKVLFWKFLVNNCSHYMLQMLHVAVRWSVAKLVALIGNISFSFNNLLIASVDYGSVTWIL